jgi:hypothetical protein
MKQADPLLDPIGYLVTSKTQPKAPSLEDRSKSDGFAGEKSRLEEEYAAELRLQANLREFDTLIKPAVKKIEALLNRGQYVAFIEKKESRLATAWAGKWIPLARVGVEPDGIFVNNDREESWYVGSAREAMAQFLQILQPALREAARAKQSEAEREERQQAQENYLREERRRRLTV